MAADAPLDTAPAPPRQPPEPSGYAYYVLAVLVAVNLFNFVDRNIVSVLLQQIKADFDVSDEWLGLLTGMAFVVVNSVLGIPIARWADRGSRRTIIALGLTVWSTMTALSGAARSFGQLLFLRMGVGVGEAAGTPPSHSMISDYFPPERRGRALAIYALGIYFGIMFGYLAAGWLGQYLGWRKTFVAVGVPGLGLALLLATTVREPERTTSVEAHPFGEVVRYLLGRSSYVWLLGAASFHAAAGYGVAHWGPTFFLRVHEMSYAAIGTWLGLLTGICGGAGAMLGGVLSDRLGARDARWYAWVTAIAAALSLPLGAAFLLSPEQGGALFYFGAHIFFFGVYTGPLFAMNQGVAKPRMRAMAVAVHLFVVNILGGGVGPWIVGRLNDALRPDYGEAGIRYSLLLIFGIGTAMASLCYIAASRSLRRDFEEAVR